MVKKVSDLTKKKCKENYEAACNAYLVELLNTWELDGYGYWIGNEIGGVYDYGDGIFVIGMDDIVFCIENDVTKNEYIECQDYNIHATEYGFNMINLKSWHNGVPHVSDETFERLDKMKQSLNAEIEKEKESLKQGKKHIPF